MRWPQRVAECGSPPKFHIEQLLGGRCAKNLAPSASGFGIVFGEADPPFAKRSAKSPTTHASMFMRWVSTGSLRYEG
jgi:hypothetical protein